MSTFNKKNLLSELHDRLELVRNNVQPFCRLSEEQLNSRAIPGKWSIAEIFEHLNITHGLYLRAINNVMADAPINNKDKFNSGWMGNLFYNIIMPRPDGTVFKLKAPKKLHSKTVQLNGREVLGKFLQQIDEFDHILELSAYVDLQKVKIPLSFTNLVKLRLGDILRFIAAHSERHLLQAQRVMKKLSLPDNYSAGML
jgi:hypothetical protein